MGRNSRPVLVPSLLQHNLFLVVKNLMIPMRRVNDCFDGVEICFSRVSNSTCKLPDLLDDWMNAPIPPSGPISVLAITFTDRSCCTLPMISTAWLRCQLESYISLIISDSLEINWAGAVERKIIPLSGARESGRLRRRLLLRRVVGGLFRGCARCGGRIGRDRGL